MLNTCKRKYTWLLFWEYSTALSDTDMTRTRNVKTLITGTFNYSY